MFGGVSLCLCVCFSQSVGGWVFGGVSVCVRVCFSQSLCGGGEVYE